MRGPRRTAVYLDADVHRALRLRATEAKASISSIVNDAVRQALAEDSADLDALKNRAREPALNFESVVRDFKQLRHR